jgi:hypothetical protein
MDAEFAKWLATLGVGGVLAGLMFSFYRKDMKQYTDMLRHERGELLVVVRENTVSNVNLINVVKSLHRRLDREQERES